MSAENELETIEKSIQAIFRVALGQNPLWASMHAPSLKRMCVAP